MCRLPPLGTVTSVQPPEWSAPVLWSALGRGERLVLVAERFDEMRRHGLTPDTLSLLYKTASELSTILEAADDSQSMYSSMHPDSFTTAAYRARSEFLSAVSAKVQSESFTKDLASHLYAISASYGIDMDEGLVVWSIEGRFPPHKNSRELLVYLAASQLGPEPDKIGIHQTFLEPHTVPADLVVLTPKWVHNFLKEVSPGSVGSPFRLTPAELDYLRGLRRTRRRLSELPSAVQAARTLARAAVRSSV